MVLSVHVCMCLSVRWLKSRTDGKKMYRDDFLHSRIAFKLICLKFKLFNFTIVVELRRSLKVACIQQPFLLFCTLQ